MHRHPNGRWQKRPGAKGFKPLEPPKADSCEDTPPSKKAPDLARFAEKNRSSR